MRGGRERWGGGGERHKILAVVRISDLVSGTFKSQHFLIVGKLTRKSCSYVSLLQIHIRELTVRTSGDILTDMPNVEETRAAKRQ